MNRKRLSLGLDLSTQGISAVVVDIDVGTKAAECSLDYAEDPRLNIFGIRKEDYLLPPRTGGEADQPPEMYLAAIDAIFSDLKESVALEDIRVINISGQQHGHVYLNKDAAVIFARLRGGGETERDLRTLLRGCLAYDRAPVWMTSNTVTQANFVRNAVGGKRRMIELSGSDAQLRFTGIVIRRTAEQSPQAYGDCRAVHLISSFIPAVLTANAAAPVDFGNACGTSMMNYRRKRWSDALVWAVSCGLPGGAEALRRKLPAIVAPDAIVGSIGDYFVRRYGFSPGCKVAAGSGDNPQSKVLVTGDLLSLGSSFVNMVSTDGKAMDISGASCAMYDGIGRPFMFGCRTNGTLVWDRLRALYGMEKDDYGPAERALQKVVPGEHLIFWQPRDESFPVSGAFGIVRIGNTAPGFDSDYCGLVESSLAAVYLHSRDFLLQGEPLLHVVGGATGSRGVMRRVAAIWNRPVVPTGEGGAALGASVAGVRALLKSEGAELDVEELSEALVQRGSVIDPLPEDVAAFHRPGGYLDRFAAEEASLLQRHQIRASLPDPSEA